MIQDHLTLGGTWRDGRWSLTGRGEWRDGEQVDNKGLTLGAIRQLGEGTMLGGAFSWTPSEAQGPGSYTFDVVVTDDGSPCGPRTFAVLNPPLRDAALGTLLRVASVTAFGLVLAGAVLATLAVRRRWRVAHRSKQG